VTTYTRRQLLAGSAVALGGLAVSAARAGAVESAIAVATAVESSTASGGSDPVATAKTIHQEEDYDAGPARIYGVLLDARQFTAMSDGRKAEIDPRAGGTFSLFAGHIIGRQLELVPDVRIVQAWRVVTWPEGVYSIARFDLRKRQSGTRLVFDHNGFPSELAEHLATGWQENYWKPMRKYLG
jgi:activator of HSP90 ATPase